MSTMIAKPEPSASASTLSQHDHSDEDPIQQQESETVAAHRLRRRLDCVLLPTVFLLDLVGLLVRSNIGNARIQGLERDLHMDPKSTQFNTVLSVIWSTQIAFAIPSNLIQKRVNPAVYLSALAVASGIISMCQAFVQSYGSLIACRVLLGVFTAGISPGSVFLVSNYYSRWELQRRYAVMWSCGYVANAFGGLFAFALAKLDGVSGMSGWRWIFLVEGLLGIAVGFIARFALMNWPENERSLTMVQKGVLKAKMEKDNAAAGMDTLDRKAVMRIIKDWKIHYGAVLYFSITVSSASLLYFLPTILKQYGYTAAQAQLHTIPIWVVSAFVTGLVGFFSDRYRRRVIFIYIGCVITMVGIIMLFQEKQFTLGVKYLALIITAMGVFTVQPITVMWMVGNLSGQCKRAVATAFQIGWGNIGSIVASNIFLTREAPTFPTGLGVALGFIGVEALTAAAFALSLKRENRKRDQGKRDDRWSLPKTEIDNMGDDRPDFRFSY